MDVALVSEGGSGGGIRKWPLGFWAPFNEWWRAEGARTASRRPSSEAIRA